MNSVFCAHASAKTRKLVAPAVLASGWPPNVWRSALGDAKPPRGFRVTFPKSGVVFGSVWKPKPTSLCAATGDGKDKFWTWSVAVRIATFRAGGEAYFSF